MKDVIVISLIAIAAFWGQLIGPETVSVDKEEIKAVLKIDEPQESALKKVSDVKDFNIEAEDALKLAVFNYGFAKRIEGYKINSQQVNDLYTESGRNMFDTTLKGKYKDYSTFITNLIKDGFEDEKVHELSDLEKEKISDNFEALSWVLLHQD